MHSQLRPTFACRRKTNTEEPNSVEKGAHQRKAPAPVRVCFAGGGRVRNSYLRRESVRRRTECDYALSSGQHSLTGGQQIVGTTPPSRKALIGGRHQHLRGFALPELERGQTSYLRGAVVRRRTASDSVSSSGQHSLAGGRRIPKSPTPLRGALTGGRHKLPLGFASPELVRVGIPYLRRPLVRRRTGSDSAPSSG